jgi:hypothetical protein
MEKYVMMSCFYVIVSHIYVMLGIFYVIIQSFYVMYFRFFLKDSKHPVTAINQFQEQQSENSIFFKDSFLLTYQPQK